jgi:endogenous inhibitor of DNA gyrase (YacG/DUF329 family)
MKCPICKKEINESESRNGNFHPFCSERCKLIDLGRWLSGKYQIPVKPDDDEADSPTIMRPPSDDDDQP